MVTYGKTLVEHSAYLTVMFFDLPENKSRVYDMGVDMAKRILRFFILLDDLAEVIVVHVLFSRKNWWKTIAVLLVGVFLLSPSFTSTRERGPAKYAKKGYTALARGRYERAVTLLSKAVKRAPTNAVLRQHLGLACLEAGQCERALTVLLESYRIRSNPRTLFYMGCAYEKLKLYDAAIGLFEQARCGLDSASISAKIGECLVFKGDHVRGLSILSRTVTRYPRSAQAHFSLGIAYWETNQHDAANQQFLRVIQLSPREAAAYYNVSCYYSVKGVKHAALIWLKRALALGFTHFKHMESDPDMNPIRHLPQYKKMVAHYQNVYNR